MHRFPTRLLQQAGLALFALCLLPAAAAAQGGLLDRLGRKVEQRANRKVDQAMDKGLDKAESKIDQAARGDQQPADAPSGSPAPAASGGSSDDPGAGSNGSAGTDAASGPVVSPVVASTKFDFVPGDREIFRDELAGEEVGEFPSKWKLLEGGAEVVSLGQGNAIRFSRTRESRIQPLILNMKALPESWTLEFDMYWGKGEFASGYDFYFVDFKDHDVPQEQLGTWGRIWFVPKSGKVNLQNTDGGGSRFDGDLSPAELAKLQNQWVHVSVAGNGRSLKVYLNQTRLLNVPNMEGKPQAIVLGFALFYDDRGSNYLVRNVRLAEGGKKLYDQVFTDGKIVTYGITFDLNQASIRPDSEPTVAEIAQLMQQNPNLRLRIEGHTDQDGDAAANLKLSEARAAAVKNALVAKGIAADRLETAGRGETQLLSAENTPEAKARNRRVEFVRL